MVIKVEPEELCTANSDDSFTSTRCSETPRSVPLEDNDDRTESKEEFNSVVKLELDGSYDIERPQRKQRVIMEVVVPTLDQLRKKRIKESQEIKLKKLFKPKGKNNDVTILSNEVLLRRLEPVGLDPLEINLSRSEINQVVNRTFMSSVYGGSMQATCPDISRKNFEKHGLADFMYLHLDYQPLAPQTPGGSGLWFSTGEDEPEHGFKTLRRVFTRDWKKSIWQYMGQYKVMPSQALTLDEWLDQSDKVKSTWAKKICKVPWGGNVCARIQVRKAIGPGRKPTKAQVTAAFESGIWKQTTQEEVLQAFNSGIEKLGVWTMKCVRYDRDFQLELCQKFPQWTPPPTSKKPKEKKLKQPIKQETTRASLKGKQRKYVEIETESEEEYPSELDMEMDED